MATLRSAVKALLAADTTLLATLTGGVYDRRGISRTGTPAAYDTTSGLIKPCAVVTVSSDSRIGPAEMGTEEDYLIVYVYEADGNHYAAIDVAKDRIKTLLDRQTVTVTSGKVLDAEMSTVRFLAWRKRG